MPNRTGAPPQLHRLLRVVPVAQTRGLDGGSLVVASLELYAEGFLLHTQLRTDARPLREEGGGPGGAPPGAPGTWQRVQDFRSPQLLIETTDDRGGTYDCWSGGGYGGGAASGQMVWRQDYYFAPAPDPAAGELRLSVPALEWVSHGTGQPRPTVAATQPIGWALVVPLG
jgi:hypothetical protein